MGMGILFGDGGPQEREESTQFYDDMADTASRNG